jgi:hypothetical protein
MPLYLLLVMKFYQGRTQDKNVAFISNWLNSKCGISVEEGKNNTRY